MWHALDRREGAAGGDDLRDGLGALADTVVRKVDTRQGAAGGDGLRDGLAALDAETVIIEVDARQGAALRNCHLR